jgi:hypothetical protein
VWLSKQCTNFAPAIVRVSKSGKDFPEHSTYPTLVVDTTLPQYRADSVDAKFVPTRNQYPVWYFFYGNLAVPDILSRRLGLSEKPVFTPATVTGALSRSGGASTMLCLTPTARKLHASMDGHILSRPRSTRRHFDFYETENYEIVQCTISMGWQVKMRSRA